MLSYSVIDLCCSNELQRVDGEHRAGAGTRAGQSDGDRSVGGEWRAGWDGGRHGRRRWCFGHSQTCTRQVTDSYFLLRHPVQRYSTRQTLLVRQCITSSCSLDSYFHLFTYCCLRLTYLATTIHPAFDIPVVSTQWCSHLDTLIAHFYLLNGFRLINYQNSCVQTCVNLCPRCCCIVICCQAQTKWSVQLVRVLTHCNAYPHWMGWF